MKPPPIMLRPAGPEAQPPPAKGPPTRGETAHDIYQEYRQHPEAFPNGKPRFAHEDPSFGPLWVAEQEKAFNTPMQRL